MDPVEHDTVSGKPTAEKIRVLESKLEHFPVEESGVLRSLFMEFADVWLWPQSGRMKTEAHFACRGSPIRSRARPLAPEMDAECRKQIRVMLAKDVVRPSKSPWVSVPVFARKADGSWRMAIDYHRINDRIVFDAYPIPRLWDVIQRLGGRRYYTCLDACWGFWNMPLAEECRKFTAVLTPLGLYEYNVLPFGIKNSPGEFQRAMDNAFGQHTWLMVYIDDMSFGSDTFEDTVSRLRQILLSCRSEGVYLKIEKAYVHAHSVPVLGHVVSREGVSPDPKKVRKIKAAVPPQSKAEIRSFVGAVQFLSRYVDVSRVLEPVIRLTAKNVVFDWTEDCQQAFDNIKELLSEHMLLSRYDPVLPLCLVTDASDRGIGACLFQVRDKEFLPLEFYSKKLSEAERKYDVREKEMLAIRRSLEHFDAYCKATHTYVFSDHESLRWMASSTSGRVQRWSLAIQNYSLTITYIPGPSNVIADWLSRSAGDDDRDSEIERISVPTVWNVETDGWWALSSPVAPFVPTVSHFKEALSAESAVPDHTYVRVHDDSAIIPAPAPSTSLR
ncbi:MAG: reverse transcriptase/ribonuclease H family protein, partial [Longimicrobiales bacterium]